MGYGNLEHGLVADPGGIDGAVGVGFFDKMDPLAVEAALQVGQVQGIVDATDDYLSSQGEAPLPDFVTTVLDSTSGYDFTSWLDGLLTSGLTELSTLPGMADLNPAVLFDGLPLISGTSFIDSVNEYLTEFYSQIIGAL